jgi:SAM-dependent methyltransferase
MLHHLPDPLKRRGMAEIHRVLKPAGRLVAVRCQHGSICARGVHLAFDWERARNELVLDRMPVWADPRAHRAARV